jgi:hypothetical protein
MTSDSDGSHQLVDNANARDDGRHAAFVVGCAAAVYARAFSAGRHVGSDHVDVSVHSHPWARPVGAIGEEQQVRAAGKGFLDRQPFRAIRRLGVVQLRERGVISDLGRNRRAKKRRARQ